MRKLWFVHLSNSSFLIVKILQDTIFKEKYLFKNLPDPEVIVSNKEIS